MNSPAIYELKGVTKIFAGPVEEITILRGIDLTIARGDSLAILGASGSGKTTLLHLLGTLDIASQGTILFQGRELTRLTPRERAEVRNQDIGFVFQFHHLLPEFTTLENVAMPARIGGMDRRRALDLAAAALELVGLQERATYKVTTLSGGERQRAAIARAILLKPKVLLADEPTGNLDEQTGEKIGEVFARLNQEHGMTLVMVTHNRTLAHRMGRNLELRSGELYDFG